MDIKQIMVAISSVGFAIFHTIYKLTENKIRIIYIQEKKKRQ